jgi:hypothetical protein
VLLANSVAEDHWRLNRIRAIEENIFALGCATVELDVSAHPNVRQALLMAQTFLESAKTAARKPVAPVAPQKPVEKPEEGDLARAA